VNPATLAASERLALALLELDDKREDAAVRHLVDVAERLVAEARVRAAATPAGQCCHTGCYARASRGVYGAALCDEHGGDLTDWSAA